MKCLLHKLGKVDGRYQYCTRCGEAVIVPCACKWVTVTTYELRDKNKELMGHNLLQECAHCGEPRNKKVLLDRTY